MRMDQNIKMEKGIDEEIKDTQLSKICYFNLSYDSSSAAQVASFILPAFVQSFPSHTCLHATEMASATTTLQNPSLR